MKTDFYCLDADNQTFIFPEMQQVKASMPNTAFHPATVSAEKREDEKWELTISIIHGCYKAVKVFESSIVVDQCPDELQLAQLRNAWTICNRMTEYYKWKLFHKLFFSLVLRDSWVRNVFQEWVKQATRNRHIRVPNLIAPGPIAAEIMRKKK